MKTKTILFAIIISIFSVAGSHANAKEYLVKSPNNKLKIHIAIGDIITYAVSLKDKTIITPSAISMTLDHQTLGVFAKIKKTKTQTYRGEIKPLYGQNATLNNDYNELAIDFSDNYSLIFRAYNEGVAYRFVTRIRDTVTVLNEKAEFNLNPAASVIFPETDTFTSWEVPYVRYNSITAITANKKAITPSLFIDTSGTKVVIAESDLLDYPGMYLQKQAQTIAGIWANYPSETALGSWGNFVSIVKKRADFIARTSGNRAFPWRIIIATDEDKDLLNNQLVYKLATPAKISNTSWIKPGKATWEWWHDAILEGAPIPSGMDNRNTALYNYYVDFAAANHMEYLMIDAGWADNYNLLKVNPKLDIKSVIERAKSKGVGVFVWCVATTLMKDMDKQLDFLKSIGAAGIKVDFIDRDDQLAIQWFEEIASAAAKRNLMVNFHGCSKPTGLQRTYPNIVNYEAVRGAECAKWDYTVNPEHHLLIPFIRMIAGPMDYTPGSMRNKTKETFKPIDPGLPSTMGTRCHELAMFVLFDQPLAMLCDSPTEYVKYPDIMKFLSDVPTTFDETKVLDAKVGEYALLAKKKQNKWFIGVMNNWESRTLKLDFSFLPDHKSYTLSIYTDAENADKDASSYVFKTIQVTKQTILNLPLAKGGGAVASLSL